MIKNIKKVSEILEAEVKKFTDIAIIGISGGVDSSVVASVCVAALGKENVHLVSMPYDNVDLATFNEKSTRLANRLGAHHHVITIKDACNPISEQLEKTFGKLEVLTYANIRPRVRMNILYSVCGQLGLTTQKRARVMGTGHLSEDVIGYDTKGGDALCDFFILADLVKSEVYQLAEYYNVESDIINAKPSAGLYPDQTDEGELGFTYAELETATLKIRDLIIAGQTPQEISENDPIFNGIETKYVNFVVSRYKTHFHKHQAPLNLQLRNKELFD